MPMRRGTSRNSGRSNIWVYEEGPRLNAYNALHAAFVSQRLLIDEVLEISRSEISELYLDWIHFHFNQDLIRPSYKDLHNLCLHLLICQGVDEDGEVFIGVGRRP